MDGKPFLNRAEVSLEESGSLCGCLHVRQAEHSSKVERLSPKSLPLEQTEGSAGCWLTVALIPGISQG